MVQGLKLNSNTFSTNNNKKSKQGMVQGLHFELFNNENSNLRRSTKKSQESLRKNSILDDGRASKEGRPSRAQICTEGVLYAVGLLAGALSGTIQPIILVMYGEYTTSLISRHTAGSTGDKFNFLPMFGGGFFKLNATEEETFQYIVDDSRAFGLGGLILSLIQFITAALTILLLNYVAQKKISYKRQQFLKAMLRQDISWHDTQNSASSITASLTEIEQLKEGIGEKMGIFVYLLSSFLMNVVIAFFYGWKLTLVMTSLCPLFIGAAAVVARMQNSMAVQESNSYGRAGAVAEEVLSSIRTVAAFGGEDKEVERYGNELGDSKRIAIRNGIYSGLGTGTTWMLVFGSYALAFWYGTPLILNDRFKEDKSYTPGVLAIVLFGVTMGAMNIGYTSPYIEAFVRAKAAATKISSILNRKSKINPFSSQGKQIKGQLGEIEFKDVYFNYPSRPNVKVLQGLSLKINPGESVALVGASGSGKSTTIQLLERFYDTDQGTVLINGVNIKEIELGWLRRQIGLVGQEPVLFNATIAENICGDSGVSVEEMINAAKMANAHNFISALPQGYETTVGEGSSRFSGGQKQRIAIARALVRKPAILLLDEATSALDVANESIVQSALDRASEGRTTLIVSHRLSAIQNVDRIVVIQGGRVAEEGRHAELMVKKGLYFNLVSADADLQQSNQAGSEDAADKTCAAIDNVNLMEQPDLLVTCQERNDASSKTKPTAWSRLLKLNGPELGYTIIGSLGAFTMGMASPISAIFYGTYVSVLAYPDEKEVLRMANWYSIAFVVVSIVVFVTVFIEFSALGIAGARLTHRLRVLVFSRILKQDMTWFDNDKHGVGVLSSRLSGDTTTVQGATGAKLGTLLQGVSTLGIGLLIAMYFSWKMTLACSISIPVILCSLVVEAKLTSKANLKESNALEQAAKVAVESVANIRTVASLGRESDVLAQYCKVLEDVDEACATKAKLRAFAFAMGQSSLNFTYSLAVWYGGYLIRDDRIPYQNTIIVAEAIVFGSWMVSQILAFVPNISAARYAATRLFDIIDREPQLYEMPTDTGPIDHSGNIKYSDVRFAYPKRPDTNVLDGLELSIKEGQKVALVGLSGCGKSTCIQLLQRFYDVHSGSLTVGGKEVASVSLKRLRNEQSIVSQEPVLFNRTIAENIAYGDNSRTVPMDEIIGAATKANIHEFIASLPAGYETKLGARGFQLSGGQKQRIAIARALIRNPRLLILDEATSALDTQSEKVVQEALEEAMEGRTCVMIAHRLSTVTRCDVIYVLSKGAVVECGTHAELVARNQHYAQLLQQQ